MCAERTLRTGCLLVTVTGFMVEHFSVLSKSMQVGEEGQKDEDGEVKSANQRLQLSVITASHLCTTLRPPPCVSLCVCVVLEPTTGGSTQSHLLWSIEPNSPQVAKSLKDYFPSAQLC